MSVFVDEAQVHLKAGDGGAGAVSFRREAHEDKGGPDGGDGGKGGDVWLVADSGRSSLVVFRDHPFHRAQDGVRGGGKRRHGQNGTDLYVAVPVGTVVRDLEGSVVCDLSGSGNVWLGARGGRPGRGNARFLTNARRAPRFAELAEHGEERWYDLELKLLADVAIVGFPNAGKSTLISRVSAAKPRIADYPFTTLEPHLGVVKVPSDASGDYDDFVIADIPGIIPGAAQGRGLGLKFLRHIERASILLLLIDMSDMAEMPPTDQIHSILSELEQYNPHLLERPRLIVGSRIDMAGMAGTDVSTDDRIDITISSVVGQGIDQMLFRLNVMLKEVRSSTTALAGASPSDSLSVGIPVPESASVVSPALVHHVVVHRPMPEGITISRDTDGTLTVSGRDVLRAVALTGLDDVDTAMYVSHKLDRLGVDKALKKAGARDGDLVRIGDVEFTYYDEGSVAVTPLSASTRRQRPSE